MILAHLYVSRDAVVVTVTLALVWASRFKVFYNCFYVMSKALSASFLYVERSCLKPQCTEGMLWVAEQPMILQGRLRLKFIFTFQRERILTDFSFFSSLTTLTSMSAVEVYKVKYHDSN